MVLVENLPVFVPNNFGIRRSPNLEVYLAGLALAKPPLWKRSLAPFQMRGLTSRQSSTLIIISRQTTLARTVTDIARQAQDRFWCHRQSARRASASEGLVADASSLRDNGVSEPPRRGSRRSSSRARPTCFAAWLARICSAQVPWTLSLANRDAYGFGNGPETAS